MNKKGFTLIELLGVIVLLGVIAVIAVTAVGNVSNNVKDEMLKKKVTFIEEAAILYGEDMKGSILNSTKTYNSYKCIAIDAKALIPKYLSADSDNCSNNCIKDPSNDNNYLDNIKVIIYSKKNRIQAKMNINGDVTCS